MPEDAEPAPFATSESGSGSGSGNARQADDASPSSARRHTLNYWGKEQTVDERLDPYSARDYSYTREGKAQILKDVLANEQGVERIVRGRTWSLLGERCLDSEGGQGIGTAASGGWEEAMESWKRGRR